MAKVHHLPRAARAKPPKGESYLLRLFTTGNTPRSVRALRNLHDICETSLKGRYRLEVIDIYQEPGRASESDIIAAPTLIKEAPLPMKRMVGDLSDRSRVLISLSVVRGEE